jgi:hypothetical protein
LETCDISIWEERRLGCLSVRGAADARLPGLSQGLQRGARAAPSFFATLATRPERSTPTIISRGLCDMTTSDFQKQVLKHERFQSVMAGAQTGMTAMQLAASNVMNRQLSDIRRQNADALAMHQEMLAKEELQAQLEEFIYASQKMLDGFDDPSCDVAPVARYVQTRTIVENVDDWGLDTSIIRGRENKAAFERMLQQAKTSVRRLESTSKEVQDALAWAEAESKRIEIEEAKTAEKKKLLRDEIEKKIAELTKHRRLVSPDEWYSLCVTDRIDAMVIDGEGISGEIVKWVKLIAQAFLWIGLGYLWIPVLFLTGDGRSKGFVKWYSETIVAKINAVLKTVVLAVSRILHLPLYYATKEATERKLNKTIDEQIVKLREGLAAL